MSASESLLCSVLLFRFVCPSFLTLSYHSKGFGSDILSKITYVTVYMPVVLMLILVIRTPFLEGAGDGIEFYIGK